MDERADLHLRISCRNAISEDIDIHIPVVSHEGNHSGIEST